MANNIVDASDNYIVDASGVFLVDTGVTTIRIPATIWTGNDAI